jgi:hypothetical protein
MKKNYQLRAFGITLSATLLAAISLAVFAISLYLKAYQFITDNLNFFLYGSLVAVVFFIIVGVISVSQVKSKVKL